MGSIEHGSIFKISLAMLIAIGMGLISGTASLVSLSNATDQHRRDITELKERVRHVEYMRQDVAVTREKVENIERLLEKRGK
jgi:hypothetical protein